MKNIKKIILVICLFAMLPLQSCLDPKAVTDFASAAAETISLVDAYGKDIMASRERIREILADNQQPKDIDAYKAVQSVESILLAYVVNLQRLADKDGATFTENTDALEEEIKKLEKFDNDKIAAVRSVASSIGEAIASGYRQKQLKIFIPKTDAAFAKVLTGLKEFVDIDYRGMLTQELHEIQNSLNNFKTDHPTEPGAVKIFTKQMNARQRDVNKKLASIDEYKKAVDTLITAHHELATNASNIGADEVVAKLKEYSTTIKKSVKEIKEAF